MDQKKYIGIFLPIMMINIFFIINGVRVVVKYWYDTNDWHFWAAIAGAGVFLSFSIGVVAGYFVVKKKAKLFNKE